MTISPKAYIMHYVGITSLCFTSSDKWCLQQSRQGHELNVANVVKWSLLNQINKIVINLPTTDTIIAAFFYMEVTNKMKLLDYIRQFLYLFTIDNSISTRYKFYENSNVTVLFTFTS